MKIFLLSSLLLFSCSEIKNETHYERMCTNHDSNELQTFILDCIKRANPMSDEEPEDYIRQCQYTAETVICDEVQVEYTYACEFRRCRLVRKEIVK